MEENLIDRLKKELKQRKVSVPSFAEKTGIPKDRVYKWLKRATGKIDYEDAIKVKSWLNGQMDNVPRETNKQEAQPPLVVLADSINKLIGMNDTNSRSIENLTITHDRDSVTLATLVKILEENFKDRSRPKRNKLPPPGSPGTGPIKRS